MAKVTKAMTESKFFCTKCGHEGLPIMRPKGHRREPGHLKKLYCIYCQEEINHAEIRDIEGYTENDFKQEFELGRFINGNRVETKNLFNCSKIDCPYNINGQCWNANKSYECRHRPQIGKENEKCQN